ncbi:EthD domain-containing protein [Spectribacter hydrogenoxidans]|uniref:EthD domain-containing protein n=1 Tax=Spectribacter hydrogenoxidans TaxID=3075608 RepID=A0ABU3BYV3_9GAMM|nr:EthD domain-containing protein [Salinisphaera sp. W335]MDT0634487.1 EthD domain-containing protein [Salinisphaera sp. W335]
MIKLVYICHRRSDFTPEAFYDRWLNVHGPLVKSVAEQIGARRYVQSHKLDTSVNEQLREARGMAEPYDGITEVWWDSMDDLIRAAETEEGQAAMQRLVEDEAEFLDLSKSYIFMTEEHTIFEF